MQHTDLSKYQNKHYRPGGNFIIRLSWFYVNAIFFKTSLLPINGFKRVLLRIFGAKVGAGTVIKPGVNIKYPWNLSIGKHCWVGENVWIDNLVKIDIGDNVCLSQGAMLFTGSHDYKRPTFNLIVKPIVLSDGVWIGAGAVITLGVIAASHAVLTAGSVATKNLEDYCIYQGNPACKVRDRHLTAGEPEENL